MRKAISTRLADRGDQEHPAHDLHQNRLVFARGKGDPRRRPGACRACAERSTAQRKLIVDLLKSFGFVRPDRTGRWLMSLMFLAAMMMAQAPVGTAPQPVAAAQAACRQEAEATAGLRIYRSYRQAGQAPRLPRCEGNLDLGPGVSNGAYGKDGSIPSVAAPASDGWPLPAAANSATPRLTADGGFR